MARGSTGALLLQLSDSAFPTGGFQHSGGLEAAAQLGEVRSLVELERFVVDAVWQAGHGALPLVLAARADPRRWEELDVRADAFLTSHVANRASRTQGRALLHTAAHVFSPCAPLKERARPLHAHHSPSLGVVLAALDLPADEAAGLTLHLALRTVLSAAVRLGLVGPLEAQRLQHHLGPLLDEVRRRCGALTVEDLAQTAPLADLLGAAHDRLYSRLFQT